MRSKHCRFPITHETLDAQKSEPAPSLIVVDAAANVFPCNDDRRNSVRKRLMHGIR
jgi:hypothetical protein